MSSIVEQDWPAIGYEITTFEHSRYEDSLFDNPHEVAISDDGKWFVHQMSIDTFLGSLHPVMLGAEGHDAFHSLSNEEAMHWAKRAVGIYREELSELEMHGVSIVPAEYTVDRDSGGGLRMNVIAPTAGTVRFEPGLVVRNLGMSGVPKTMWREYGRQLGAYGRYIDHARKRSKRDLGQAMYGMAHPDHWVGSREDGSVTMIHTMPKLVRPRSGAASVIYDDEARSIAGQKALIDNYL